MEAEGRAEEVAFRATDVDGAAMTARRWLSLAEPGGDDDMFSSGLGDARLAAVLGPMAGLPTLVLVSGAEEYVPPDLDYRAAMQRVAQVSRQRAPPHEHGEQVTACAGTARHEYADQAWPAMQFCSNHASVCPCAQTIGPSASLEVVEGARHALNGKEEEGAAAIAKFVSSLGPGGGSL
jgi:hypothetical protein